MQNKVSVNTNIGMLRDRSISKVDNQFAFDNHNIRITARDKDTLLSVTNERGNNPVIFSSSQEAQDTRESGLFTTEIKGTLLGHAVLNKYLVLFTKLEVTDYIYRAEYRDSIGEWYLRLLYQGKLGFDLEHPIETISLFETEDVQKVYWVDGINQPRVINIKKNYLVTNSIFAKETIFDFVTDYNHSGSENLTVSVEKQHLGMGSFPAGTIQYLCTYYNKYGQETNPVYISPIYYVSPEGRGGDPETTYTCSFKISFNNPDTDFDYIRVYAILRTSESGTPISYIVGTINIKTETGSIVDSGQGDNIPIDPTILLYIGGREITAGTFSHKDNTLFLGDLKFISSKNDADIQRAILECDVYNNNPGDAQGNYLMSNIVSFIESSDDLCTPYYENTGLYPYESQLDNSSAQITGFKGGEKYRFAIQFLTPTGQRSKAFFIGDKTNNVYPRIDKDSDNNPVIRRPIVTVQIPARLATVAYNNGEGYTQVELLMAEASDGDRAVVAQGIISPTVFNLAQRGTNAPYAISSWYMRPRNSRINSTHFDSVNNVTGISRDGDNIASANVAYCEIQNIEPDITPYYNSGSFKTQLVRIAYYLKCICFDNSSLVTRRSYTHALYAIYMFNDGHTSKWVTKPDYNSPQTAYNFPTTGGFQDADWNALKTDAYKIGSKGTDTKGNAFNHRADRRNEIHSWWTAAGIEETRFPSNQVLFYDVEDETDHPVKATYDVNIGESSSNTFYSRLNGEQFFIDENIVTLNTPDIDSLQSSSWGGLKLRIIGVSEVSSNITDYTVQTTTGLSTAATIYKTNFNHTYTEGNTNGLEGLMTYPLLFDASVTYNSVDQKYPSIGDNDYGTEPPMFFNIFPFHKEGSVTHNENATVKYSEIEKKIFANLRYCYNTKYLWTGGESWTPKEGADIAVINESQSGQFKQLTDGDSSYMYQGTYDLMSSTGSKKFGIYAYGGEAGMEESVVKGSSSSRIVDSTEPVRVQFRSLPHAVIKFKKTNWANELLPIIDNEDAFSLPKEDDPLDPWCLPWNDTKATYQKQLVYATNAPYYFIGELYKDIDPFNDDRYGGKTQAAIENNRFIPISDRKSISNTSIILVGTQGDTYFQRWDCLKTEPYSEESKNGIVDITSFMVETHTNIEGRYDTRRGLLKNVTTSSENTNKINRAYSNTNNFFSASVLNDKYYLSDFPNQITWTKTKTLAEDIDTWTNITMANSLDLDGDKGSVRAIRRFNNSLVAFQDKGIAEILFNSRTQIATTSGVPIEIANSGKVDGKRYISEKSGCVNKWSIVETKSGIYFIDNINKNISVIGEGIQDISTSKGFGSWVRSYNTLKVWNPKDRENFTSFYDSIHGDIYFVTRHENVHNDDSCLVYNEILGQFTSFFDYEDVPMMVNIGDKFTSFKDSRLWLQNEGDYNKLFGTKYPYWIKYRICPDPYGDKIFNNIEYRADIITPSDDSDVVEQVDFLTDRTFDTMKVWNEYQEGTLDLVYDSIRVSDIKKKFRIWRANIPRDSKDPRGLNRIRNPWIYLQLKKDKDLYNERMEFHDLMVKYYE